MEANRFLWNIKKTKGCIWNFLGEYDIYLGSSDNWIYHKDMLRSSIQDRYISSIYFAIISLTTIGYGDYSPINIKEMIFVGIMAIIASVVFAFIINEVSSIMLEIKQKSQEYNKNLSQMNAFMNERQVNQKLQLQARNYLDFVYQQGINDSLSVKTCLSQLSVQLRESITKDIFTNILKSIPILKNYFSHDFLQALTLKVKEKSYGPDEVIFNRNEITQQKFYIVQKGQIEVYIQHGAQTNLKTKVFEVFQKGDIFGINEFFRNSQSFTYSCKSLGVSQVYYFTYDDFFNLLKDFPKDLELFTVLKDELIYKQKYMNLNLKCYSCKSQSHLINECKFVQYNPHVEKLINTYEKQKEKFIKNFKRQNIGKKRVNVYKDLEIIQEEAEFFQEDNEQLLAQIENNFLDQQSLELYEQYLKDLYVTSFQDNNFQSKQDIIHEESSDTVSQFECSIEQLPSNKSLQPNKPILKNNIKINQNFNNLSNSQLGSLNNIDSRKSSIHLKCEDNNYIQVDDSQIKGRFQTQIQVNNNSNDNLPKKQRHSLFYSNNNLPNNSKHQQNQPQIQKQRKQSVQVQLQEQFENICKIIEQQGQQNQNVTKKNTIHQSLKQKRQSLGANQAQNLNNQSLACQKQNQNQEQMGSSYVRNRNQTMNSYISGNTLQNQNQTINNTLINQNNQAQLQTLHTQSSQNKDIALNPLKQDTLYNWQYEYPDLQHFECLKKYKYYFPNCNYDVVVDNIQFKQKKIIMYYQKKRMQNIKEKNCVRYKTKSQSQNGNQLQFLKIDQSQLEQLNK